MGEISVSLARELASKRWYAIIVANSWNRRDRFIDSLDK